MIGMTENKNISIIVPVLNGERFIGKCLESIAKLNYPKNDFEVIIVDNGSKDRTVDIIKNFQRYENIDIKLHFQKIRSSYAARNLGIKNAKGDIIIFTDADCIVYEDWLTNIIKPFTDETVGGVAGEILSAGGDSLTEKYSIDEGVLSQRRTFNSKFLPYAQTANAAYRKELFDLIGYFDEVISGGDADYSWRMQLKTDYMMVFAEDAIVLHKHRTDLKGLFKQRFKHGYGYILIRNKYKNYQDQSINAHIPDASKSSGRINRLITNMRSKGYLILLPTLANAIGFNLGKIYARFILLTYKNQRP